MSATQEFTDEELEELAATGWRTLTPAELRVIEGVCQGLTTTQIAQNQGNSKKTVITQLSAAQRKLQLSTTTAVVAFAIRFKGFAPSLREIYNSSNWL